MSEVTWDKHDYLAVTTAQGWGRAKTAREAVKLARENSVSWIKQPKTFLYRLSDQTDNVSVEGGFGEFSISLDGGEIRKIAVFEMSKATRFVPETMDAVAIETA